MGLLPLARNTTYTAASPVRSADLNDLQDGFVGRKMPPQTRWIQPSAPLTFAAPFTYQNDRIIFPGGTGFSGMGLGQWSAGDRITGFAIKFSGGPGGALTYNFQVLSNLGNGAPVVVGTLTMVNPAAGWATYSVVLGAPHVLVDGETLFFSTATNGNNLAALGPIGVTFDRL